MAITRTAWTDDDGTGTTGTVINNAAKTSLYDQIDALFAGAFSLVGPLTVTAFGTHAFSAGGTGANVLAVRNTTAGTGNYGVLNVGNDALSNLGGLYAFASTFTSSGANYANGTLLQANGAGGLVLQAQHASGVFRVFTGGSTERMQIDTAGSINAIATGANTGFLVGAASSSYGARFCRSAGGQLLIGVPGTTNAELLQIVTNAGSDLLAVNGVGNVSLGPAGTNRATIVGTRAIQLFDGTEPTGTLANGVSIYSKAGKLWARDAAGAATQLTP